MLTGTSHRHHFFPRKQNCENITIFCIPNRKGIFKIGLKLTNDDSMKGFITAGFILFGTYPENNNNEITML